VVSRTAALFSLVLRVPTTRAYGNTSAETAPRRTENKIRYGVSARALIVAEQWKGPWELELRAGTT